MLAKRRRSILVRSAASEEGPKNPFKGTTVKLLVLASYAQFGVGAERKRGPPRLRIQGVLQWHGEADPVFVETCLCAQAYSLLWYHDLCTTQAGTCIAVLPGHRAVNAVCRVACLAWVWRIGDHPDLSPARDRPWIAP